MIHQPSWKVNQNIFFFYRKAYVPTRLLYAFFQNRLKKNLEDKLTYTYKKILELGRMPDDRVSLFCELYDGDLTEKISYTSRSEASKYKLILYHLLLLIDDCYFCT